MGLVCIKYRSKKPTFQTQNKLSAGTKPKSVLAGVSGCHFLII